MQWLDYMCASRNESSVCESVVIGKSSEQRDLKVIKVRKCKNINYSTKSYIVPPSDDFSCNFTLFIFQIEARCHQI